jgi:hypothetical protein
LAAPSAARTEGLPSEEGWCRVMNVPQSAEAL